MITIITSDLQSNNLKTSSMLNEPCPVGVWEGTVWYSKGCDEATDKSEKPITMSFDNPGPYNRTIGVKVTNPTGNLNEETIAERHGGLITWTNESGNYALTLNTTCNILEGNFYRESGCTLYSVRLKLHQ